MALIYFLRHGQTDWNVEGRHQGHIDVPLNDLGRRQAARNGRVLRSLLPDPSRFDFVASPLCRATETMEIARREIGLPAQGYRTDARLREVHRGEWQGHIFADLLARQPEACMAFQRDRWNVVPPSGESFAMLSARVLEWFRAVMRDTVVVAHGGPMRCIRGTLLSLPPEEILALPAPQDQVMRIEGDDLSWL
jgi:broad specificity phosphatase PhoE